MKLLAGNQKVAKIATGVGLLVAMYILYQDFRASVLGWGVLVADQLGNDPQLKAIGIGLSLLPQIAQIMAVAVYAEDRDKADKRLVILGGVSFILDTALDTLYLISVGANPAVAAVVTVGVFGVLSEVLVTYCAAYLLSGRGPRVGMDTGMGGLPSGPSKRATPSRRTAPRMAG